MEPGTGVGFQILGWAPCELSSTLRLTVGKKTDGETSLAKVSALWFPPCRHTSANQRDGEQCDLPPPTPKLSRYDSGVVIDTQFHVNFSKTGKKDMTKFRGLDESVQSEWTWSGLQGLWALGWHELPCRV